MNSHNNKKLTVSLYLWPSNKMLFFRILYLKWEDGIVALEEVFSKLDGVVKDVDICVDDEFKIVSDMFCAYAGCSDRIPFNTSLNS